MAYVELRQHLWLSTPNGEARAIAVIDYGQEDDLVWVCIQSSGAIWCWYNPLVRVLPNRTFDRGPADA